MRRETSIPLAFALIFATVPALAGEIVHFTNGTTMEIESHVIEDGIIRVQLSGQAIIAFSVEQIDRIETLQGGLAPLDRNGAANRMVPTPTAAVQHGTVPSNYRRGGWDGDGVGDRAQENIDVDKNGIAVYRPFGGEAAPNKRQFGVTGRRELTQSPASRSAGSGFAGTNRVGARHVLPPAQGGQPRRQPIGLAERGTPQQPAQEKK